MKDYFDNRDFFFTWEPETTLDDLERMAILRCLSYHEGSRIETSKTLGVSVHTVRNKIDRYRKEGYDIPPSIHGLCGYLQAVPVDR